MAGHGAIAAAPEPADLAHETAQLLGGRRALHHEISSDVQAHRLVVGGIPAAALAAFVDTLRELPLDEVLAALGVSPRSFARRKAAPKDRLPPDESGRLWQLAEILAQAKRVFGTTEEAALWLGRPARALGNEKPIELVRSPPGAQLVSQILTRLEYGVYT